MLMFGCKGLYVIYIYFSFFLCLDFGSFYIDLIWSFIFLFKNGYGLELFKFYVKNFGNVMYGNNGYGLIFGGGYDIYIVNFVGFNMNFYINLGYMYVFLVGYKYFVSDMRSLLVGIYNF